MVEITFSNFRAGLSLIKLQRVCAWNFRHKAFYMTQLLVPKSPYMFEKSLGMRLSIKTSTFSSRFIIIITIISFLSTELQERTDNLLYKILNEQLKFSVKLNKIYADSNINHLEGAYMYRFFMFFFLYKLHLRLIIQIVRFQTWAEWLQCFS